MRQDDLAFTGLTVILMAALLWAISEGAFLVRCFSRVYQGLLS